MMGYFKVYEFSVLHSQDHVFPLSKSNIRTGNWSQNFPVKLDTKQVRQEVPV
jgi:hypothetical protein